MKREIDMIYIKRGGAADGGVFITGTVIRWAGGSFVQRHSAGCKCRRGGGGDLRLGSGRRALYRGVALGGWRWLQWMWARGSMELAVIVGGDVSTLPTKSTKRRWAGLSALTGCTRRPRLRDINRQLNYFYFCFIYV